MIVSCAPVDCPENRRFIRETFKVDPTKVPWMDPYKGSVKGTCELHNGPVWVGPQQQKALKTGLAKFVICHLCAVGVSGGNVTLMSLSDKTTTTYGG